MDAGRVSTYSSFGSVFFRPTPTWSPTSQALPGSSLSGGLVASRRSAEGLLVLRLCYVGSEPWRLVEMDALPSVKNSYFDGSIWEHQALVIGPGICVLAFCIQQGRLCTVGADLGHELVRDKLVRGLSISGDGVSHATILLLSPMPLRHVGVQFPCMRRARG